MLQTSLSTTLRTERKKRGFTQKQFAALANIPLPTYQRYESSAREPNWTQISQIAAALNMTISEFAERVEQR